MSTSSKTAKTGDLVESTVTNANLSEPSCALISVNPNGGDDQKNSFTIGTSSEVCQKHFQGVSYTSGFVRNGTDWKFNVTMVSQGMVKVMAIVRNMVSSCNASTSLQVSSKLKILITQVKKI